MLLKIFSRTTIYKITYKYNGNTEPNSSLNIMFPKKSLNSFWVGIKLEHSKLLQLAMEKVIHIQTTCLQLLKYNYIMYI
jgi:hypothetical protein